jgi:uncharacterized protein (TIGR03067 family)
VKANRRLAPVMLALAIAACASQAAREEYLPEPTGGRLDGDYQKLQGSWTVVYNELKHVTTPELYGAQHIFEGSRFRLGDQTGSERFILDETSHPKRIDFDDGRSPRVLGIYELDGDRLTICSGDAGESRPTEFKTSALSGAVLTRYERRRGP